MAHVGTITGSMTLDPSAYISGLNQAAQQTMRFQQSISSGSFGIAAMGASSARAATGLSSLNRSIYASMTAFYALSSQMSRALGVYEEYDNVLSRIGSTASMSTSSVLGLSEALKGLNRDLAVSRTDTMRGVYRAVQSGFTKKEDYVPITQSAMALRTASGREIDVTKSADTISVIRNALGIKSGREGFITDMLLKGRDVGRFELNQMASALGIPITIWGNQFSSKIGSEETLHQLITMLASSTQAGLSPTMAATGLRRFVEKSNLLGNRASGSGKHLDRAIKSAGYKNVFEAMDEGPMKYMGNILKLTGGTPQALGALGFGSREEKILAATLRDNMSSTNSFYEKTTASNIEGTTAKYTKDQKESWWYQRDRVRSAYLDSQLKLTEAMLPTMKSFATSLEVLNDLFQALGPSVKNLLGLMAIGMGANLLKNFYFRGGQGTNITHPSLNMLKVDKFSLKSGAKNWGTPKQHEMMNASNFRTPSMYGNTAYGLRNNNMAISYKEQLYSKSGRPYPKMAEGKRYGPPQVYMGGNSFSGGPAQLSKEDQALLNASAPKPGWGSKFDKIKSAGRFMFGGAAYRTGRIQESFDNRIGGATERYNQQYSEASKTSAGLYSRLIRGGVSETKAIEIAGRQLGESVSAIGKEFYKTAAAARRGAEAMSKLSGVMGTIVSFASTAAIGFLFQMISKAIEGASYSVGGTKKDGAIDLSNAGHIPSGLANFFGEVSYGATTLLQNKAQQAAFYAEDLKRKGYKVTRRGPDKIVGGQINPLTGMAIGGSYSVPNYVETPITMDDVLKDVLKSEFSKEERNAFYAAGNTGKFEGKIAADFDKFLKTAGPKGEEVKGVLTPGFLQRQNLKEFGGVNGAELTAEFLTKTLKGGLEKLANSANLTADALSSLAYKIPGIGMNLSGMEELRKKNAPNLFAVKSFWDDAKTKDAYSDEASYQKSLKEQFIRSGMMPDSYFQTRKPGNEIDALLSTVMGQAGMTPVVGKKEKLSDFFTRMISSGGMEGNKDFEASGGNMGKIQSMRGAAKFFEMLFTMGSASNADLDSLMQTIVGDKFSAIDNRFKESLYAQLRLKNPNEFIELAKTGEYDTKPVQKYSDALAYGSDAGYNAMLPYWMEQGDEKKELIFRLEAGLKIVEELRVLVGGIKDNTATTAKKVEYDLTEGD